MAVIIAGRGGSIDAVLDYNTAKDGQKRESDKILIDGINCDPDSAKVQFHAELSAWGKQAGAGLDCHTFVQSFSPDDMEHGLTMREANQMGKESVARFMSKRGYPEESYEAVVCTQADGESGLYHNHITLLNLDLRNGKALDLHYARKDMCTASDAVCKQHGYSIIVEPGKSLNAKYTQAERAMMSRNQLPWKIYIQEALDREMPCSENFEMLKIALKTYGIDAKLVGKKHVTFSFDGHRVRGQKLGNAYNRTAMDGLEAQYKANSMEFHYTIDSLKVHHPEAVTVKKYMRASLKLPKREMQGLLKTSAWLYADGKAYPVPITAKGKRFLYQIAGHRDGGKPLSLAITNHSKNSKGVENLMETKADLHAGRITAGQALILYAENGGQGNKRGMFPSGSKEDSLFEHLMSVSEETKKLQQSALKAFQAACSAHSGGLWAELKEALEMGNYEKAKEIMTRIEMEQ